MDILFYNGVPNIHAQQNENTKKNGGEVTMIQGR